jgi:hypothetical protein
LSEKYNFQQVISFYFEFMLTRFTWKMKVLSQFISVFLFVLILSNFCTAQTYSQLNKSDTLSISSKIFKAERKIIVTRSLSIKSGSKENNCILYMDADDRNINGILLQSANILMAYNEIPHSLLVGIMQEDRNSELVEKDQLLRFLTEEVIPLLETNYKISKKVTIAGHSFGAYFATYAFLKHNAIFNACIAVSPAYWPNKQDVLLLLNEKVKTRSVSGSFYLAIGDKRWDEISLRDYAFKAQRLLNHSKDIRFNFSDLEGFSHNATPTIGFGLGLSFIYDEWEWGNILEEQERRLTSDPTFWGHLEIKADALYHLNRITEATVIYREALKNMPQDEDLSDKEKAEITKRLNGKLKAATNKH